MAKIYKSARAKATAEKMGLVFIKFVNDKNSYYFLAKGNDTDEVVKVSISFANDVVIVTCVDHGCIEFVSNGEPDTTIQIVKA